MDCQHQQRRDQEQHCTRTEAWNGTSYRRAVSCKVGVRVRFSFKEVSQAHTEGSDLTHLRRIAANEDVKKGAGFGCDEGFDFGRPSVSDIQMNLAGHDRLKFVSRPRKAKRWREPPVCDLDIAEEVAVFFEFADNVSDGDRNIDPTIVAWPVVK